MSALPAGFKFGVATAAFQIEGGAHADGRGESIWDVFCRVPGAVLNGDNGDVACDHFHRWEEDLDLMVELGVESYRFSIAWPRILPTGAVAVNERGLAFYRRLAEGLLERGIEPIATLYHWDLPQPLQERGGWVARGTAERFAEFASVVATDLRDVVTRWITQNEPWCSGFLGYAEGRKAPGIRHWPSAVAATHHLLLSHGLATDAIRAAVGSKAEVGIALNLSPVHPADPSSEADIAAAHRQDGYLNRWFLDPVFRGTYPQDMLDLFTDEYGPEVLAPIRDGDLDVISTRIDFLGVNYYNPMRIAAEPDLAPLRLRFAEPREPTTAMGWEVDPEGLRTVLKRIVTAYRNLPIYITENGAAYNDPDGAVEAVADPERTAYLEGHLAALRRAMDDGVDVQRYYVWSFLDNFEWEEGYAKRFGIVHVDYATQRRVPKESALWYRDHIAAARAGDGSTVVAMNANRGD
ncbi:MAG TPA: GH1 family beta-glucosidase [Solirubrobacteraceae bacterium]|nr:GH1 family beta-glucosidase [Solirubrobacteraceae bacterium]